MRRFFSHNLFVLVVLTLVCGHAFAQAQEDEPNLQAESDFGHAVEEFPGFKKFYKNSQSTLIPVPVFSTMPDEGQTYGIMPTMIITSKDGRDMKTIISPMGGYNSVIGTMGTMAILFYPTTNSTLSLFAGAAQKYYQEYELIYGDKRSIDGRFFYEVSGRFYRNPYGRFFGLGPNSPVSAKTFYSASTFQGRITGGYNFTDQFRAALTERYYYVNLMDPIAGRTPNTLAVYGPSQGVEDSRNLTNMMTVSFNSNGFNNETIPFSQAEAGGSFLFSSYGMGSKSSFTGTDWVAKEALSYGARRLFSTVLRIHYHQVFGDYIPFFEMPSLGGPNELRGYTEGRFVDKGAAIFQLEQRTHIAHINFFKRAAGDFYIDPFFELGEVFHSASNIALRNLQPVGGVGFRFIIPPSMIARVDVGFSREENFQVFTTLNYPF